MAKTMMILDVHFRVYMPTVHSMGYIFKPAYHADLVRHPNFLNLKLKQSGYLIIFTDEFWEAINLTEL